MQVLYADTLTPTQHPDTYTLISYSAVALSATLCMRLESVPLPKY